MSQFSMSLQVFLQAKLLGTEEFLGSTSGGPDLNTNTFVGRAAWLTLFCEVLPRALLSELKLSRMLLGSSSAEQFLLVLAEDDVDRANVFLENAATAVEALSGNTLRLLWVSTENLGPWGVARKRLDDAASAKSSTSLAHVPKIAEFFQPLTELRHEAAPNSYFEEFAHGIIASRQIGWSPEEPALLHCDAGTFVWALTDQSNTEEDAIFFPRRFAMQDHGSSAATVADLAERSDGVERWAVLRGDVDHFDARLRNADSIEEHIHLSVLLKQFFAGELALLCAYPEFWRKVSLVYRGGDDFAVVGAWDALLQLAQELHRLFEKFVEQNLRGLAGVEGKTISMAISLAPSRDSQVEGIYRQCGLDLRSTKVSEAGAFHLFGRPLEWERLADAEELKNSLVRLVDEFGVGRNTVEDLVSVYRETFSVRGGRKQKAVKIEKPWRTYMRVSEVLPQRRGREFNNLRTTVVTHLLGKKTAGLKLRPSARVGLEWARVAAGE